MPALVVCHTSEIREEAVPKRVPERREPHDGVPGEVDGVELDVRQVVQHVRVERHPHLLVRGDLLLRHLHGSERAGAGAGSTQSPTSFLLDEMRKPKMEQQRALTYHEGLVGPGGVVGGRGLADGEPGGPAGEGGVREPRLGERVGGGQHQRPHLRQRRARTGVSFGRGPGRLFGVGGAGTVGAPRAEVAGRRPAPGVEARPWERRGGACRG